MYNKTLAATNNSALSSSIDGNRLLDNLFNGKNTPYLVVGAIGVTYFLADLIKDVVHDVMEHKYSVKVEEGETSVSFAPQDK